MTRIYYIHFALHNDLLVYTCCLATHFRTNLYACFCPCQHCCCANFCSKTRSDSACLLPESASWQLALTAAFWLQRASPIVLHQVFRKQLIRLPCMQWMMLLTHLLLLHLLPRPICLPQRTPSGLLLHQPWHPASSQAPHRHLIQLLHHQHNQRLQRASNILQQLLESPRQVRQVGLLTVAHCPCCAALFEHNMIAAS